MSHPRIVIVVFLAALAVVSCGDERSGSEGRPSNAIGPAQADIDDEPPYGPGAEIGETYDYVLYTHCGIEWARIDGVWWQTATLDDGNANPPSGWGNPYDTGRFVIIDQDTATYTGGADAEVDFERTDLVEAPFACE